MEENLCGLGEGADAKDYGMKDITDLMLSIRAMGEHTLDLCKYNLI